MKFPIENPFFVARLKLTAWYVMILMIVTSLFSAVFYHASTRELQRLITRMERDQARESFGIPPGPGEFGPRFRLAPDIEELKQLRQRSLLTLLFVNVLILLGSGTLSYLLAGKTLKPIKIMMRDQNDFVSNASHELRTPVATLRAEMESQLLENRISDKQARQLINSNLEELTKIQNLVQQLLQLQSLDDTVFRHKKTSLSVVAVLEEAVKNLQKQAVQKQITIEQESIEASILANQSQLVQVVSILLDNAIKYSPEKSTVTLKATEKNQTCEITVEDHGRGIGSADLPHVFKRFYRADTSRSQTEGYGLGLSIAKRIVLEHNGSISVESRPNKGSIFKVMLPLAS